MSSFSIDIERYYEELLKKDQELKGIFCIQYPIYCIHANINDVTPDPLDNLDKIIADLLVSKQDLTPFQIGSLIGTSKTLVEARIKKLLQDKLITEDGNSHLLSQEGLDVFKHKSQIRQHKQSYDFYLDGLSLAPLTKIFYSYYRFKFIGEYDSFYRTNARRETILVRPFGPDLVHTSPDKDIISKNIFSIEDVGREAYNIPKGLLSIDDISYTKMSMQLLISVSSKGDQLIKEVIDGFAIYSLAENMGYYETLRKNVASFEENLPNKIQNLEFKIVIPRGREDKQEKPMPLITSNWPEIDRYTKSQSRCFSFSSEDLVKVVEQIFQVNEAVEKSIVNENNLIAIDINKNMLINSPNRQKLISDLIRERDYKFANVDKNVFLLYLYFRTSDPFVNEVINFKKLIEDYKKSEIDLSWIETFHPEYAENYRNLLTVAGEFELLEKLDIEKYMLKLN